ncbi:helix-turn-helix transcriptional regulator [Methylovirgula sp. 4M-Z18]|uniref:helix-turn-helix transcriptional regulator n=1 Tax=Methylovirgula sp. 4M-Z18 TaxID=2293567 RepID=UPI000E2EE2E4|nr:helix-turn-helix transcriptional regulator [Methylovirgula sp. 4M-Z18]RFB79549.1 LuxR family transcriptional regulator [Methylovirgula sp. 4M-Z18]
MTKKLQETAVVSSSRAQDRMYSICADIKSIAKLIEEIGLSDFAANLVEILRQQVPFDCALVLVYRPEQRPEIMLDMLAHENRANTAKHYIGGAYLLDPFYIRAGSLREPAFLRMRDIAPTDFISSEYYVSYYKHSHVADEINHLVPDGHGGVFALCLERSDALESFSDAELAQLRAALAFVAAACRKHAALLAPVPKREPDAEHLRLTAILDNFGRDQLTRREYEVVHEILRGHSAASVALKLNVSVETVRVHRRNIYAKLGITSLAELFSLALKAVYSGKL